MYGKEGIITHLRYPLQYHNNMLSTWEIIAPEGYRIILEFDSFSLQKHPSCDFDYVAVYDGDKTTDTLIGKFCNEKPEVVRSSGHKLMIVFLSDDRITSDGFLAKWSTEATDAVIKGNFWQTILR